jgi:hypothetical protein
MITISSKRLESFNDTCLDGLNYAALMYWP